MTTKEAIGWYETKLAVNKMMGLEGPQNEAACLALDALRAKLEQPNEPLTLDELRKMARNGGYVWCADTDGTHPGLLCCVECLLDNGKDAHIWLLDNEGNAGQYNVRCMIECGASFYRRKPEKEG